MENEQSLLTKEEHEIVTGLGEIWNKFLKLQKLHDDEIPDFRGAIHTCQRIVMARPVQREYNELKEGEETK